MEDILLIVMMLAFFVFGYFVADRFGRFMDENFQGYQEAEEPNRKVFIAETKGKSAKKISKEVNTMLDSFQDCDAYEIIICKTVEPHIIEYLKNNGCAIHYSIRQ